MRLAARVRDLLAESVDALHDFALCGPAHDHDAVAAALDPLLSETLASADHALAPTSG